MKKLLGIVVLGLLLGGNVYAKTINDFIKTGMTKKQLTKVTEKLFSPYYKTPIMKKLGHTGSLFDMRKCPFHEYYPKFKTEILRHSKIITILHMLLNMSSINGLLENNELLIRHTKG